MQVEFYVLQVIIAVINAKFAINSYYHKNESESTGTPSLDGVMCNLYFLPQTGVLRQSDQTPCVLINNHGIVDKFVYKSGKSRIFVSEKLA